MNNHPAKQIRTTLMALGLLALATVSAAAEAVEFRTAIDLALKQSGTMTAAAADRERAAARYHAERDVYVPTVVLGSGLGYSIGQPVAIAGQAPSLFNLTHSQTLLNFSTRESVKAAHSDSLAADIDYADRREQLVLDVALLYIELDNTAQRLNVAREQKLAAERALYIAQQRQQEGVNSALDTKRAELDAARVDLRITELETSASVLREKLGRTIGRSPATLETVSASIPAAPPLPSADGLAAAALTSSNAVKAAEERARAAHARARAQHKLNLPSLDFAGQYAEYAAFNNYDQYYKEFSRHNYSFGLNLRIPVFNIAVNAAAAAADAEAMRADADAQAARDQVATEAVRQQQSLRQLEAFTRVSRLECEVAEGNVEAVEKQIQSGHATAQDAELARADVANHRNALLESQFEYLRAQLTLLRETGELRGWALGGK